MLVKVTKEHIRKGVPSKCSMCPIALAIREKLGEISWVQYDNVKITGHQGLIPTSIRMRKFIRDFDDGKTVKPFAFLLNYKGEK